MITNYIKHRLFEAFKRSEVKTHSLLYLFWECTQRCNLHCLHCGSDCRASATQADMPLSDFLPVLDTIHSSKENPVTIVVTGGEPLLRNDLEQCGVAFRKRNFRWGIVTNGFEYTADRHASLMGAGMGSLTISIDGLRPTHNWLRNHPQSFERAMAALPIITADTRLNADVVTCVNKRNIHELEALLQLLKDNGVKAWRLFTISPIGRAKNNSELSLSADEFTWLLNFIQTNRAHKEIDIKFSCEGYVGRYENKVRDGYFFCRAGIHIGSVLIDGSISACPNIDRSFAQGSIYHDNFGEIWANRFQLFRDRSWTKTGKCAHCKQYKHCKGNGLHYWTAKRDQVMQCHYENINRL